MTQTKENWLLGEEARRKLRVSSCNLMHLRDAGKLRFKKKGNSFLYWAEDVVRQAAQRGQQAAMKDSSS